MEVGAFRAISRPLCLLCLLLASMLIAGVYPQETKPGESDYYYMLYASDARSGRSTSFFSLICC